MQPADTFIRVVEVWEPEAEGSLLVLGGGHYGSARHFGALSHHMCFGRGEGLPGQAWETGRPIVLESLEGSVFRRTQAAQAEGLSCAIALPLFDGERLKAVVLIFCGSSSRDVAGAIELWRNDPAESRDLTLDGGHYGQTAEAFEFISRRTAFRKGTGLPGLAWESGLPVFMPDLGKGGRFLRADSAQKVGINRGFALPCSAADGCHYVMAFLSALATPIVRRFETWLPDEAGSYLLRREGFCETAGALDSGHFDERVASGSGALGQALASGVPRIGESPVAGLQTLIALPVLRAGRVAAVVAWYF
ncbi:conserved hypothetical protein [Rubrivivax sp. A210]|uniref:GAF domain-containing protein n=1 Tax=Rubrivivax sp. A210 TaxID=2772301 RepID=UPI001918C272|nr:GAF domain-containing protein [Rubrivivax sp. A210]CAD5370555.1 conserved hypothetical protein [Rubrivivax sp. A210]